eukprot:10502201-Prorocentrum_lima.AAC.1
MYVADVMRHGATHPLWTLPAFGEVVAVTNPGPKKALDKMGSNGKIPVLSVMVESGNLHPDHGHQGKTT